MRYLADFTIQLSFVVFLIVVVAYAIANSDENSNQENPFSFYNTAFTHEEHFKQCKACLNRKHDINRFGIGLDPNNRVE